MIWQAIAAAVGAFLLGSVAFVSASVIWTAHSKMDKDGARPALLVLGVGVLIGIGLIGWAVLS